MNTLVLFFVLCVPTQNYTPQQQGGTVCRSTGNLGTHSSG